jgi:glutamate 5-kinase
MTTKLAAARIATGSGVTVHLADGRDPARLSGLLEGDRGGTVFYPHPEPLGNRRSWLAHVLVPEGELCLDQGACQALMYRGASLLLVGVTAVKGEFDANQAVLLRDPDGQELGRGLCLLNSNQVRQALVGTSSEASPVVVHRDALVLQDR